MKNQLLFVAIALSMTACNPALLYNRQRSNPNPNQSADAVTFAEVEKTVFATSCMSCHAQTFPHLADYADVKASVAAIDNAVFSKHSMPKNSSLSNEQLSLLRQWIDDGAPEFDEKPTPTPTPSAGDVPTFAKLRAGLINVSCAGCHFAGNPDGRVDLTNAKDFKASLGTIMYSTLVEKEEPMPPKDKVPLTDEQKRLLTEWVIANEPEE